MSGAPVLSVSGLTTRFRVSGEWRTAVDGVSFDIGPRETVAVVGESGSGKSVTALSIMRLVPTANGRIEGGIALEGRNLPDLTEEAMRDVRGGSIGMIFQEPMTSLNPVLTVGFQVSEALRRHRGMSPAEADREALRLFDLVRIPDAARRFSEFPHTFSGGMRQRVMIAIALACRPRLLIADEPTTALDVTIQAQILTLIVELQRKLGTAVILITHDLGVVAETAQRVIVMYAGRKVEEATVGDLFRAPQHPYTRGLMASIPRLGLMRGEADTSGTRLQEIPGIVPALTDLPAGCAFAPRCPVATDKCREAYPPYEQKHPGHWAACWHSVTHANSPMLFRATDD